MLLPTFAKLKDGLLVSSWRMSTWWAPDGRNAVGQSLLRLLAVAHAERLDLPTLVDAFADEHRYAARRRLRRLATRLSQGTPLIPALEQTPNLLSDPDILTLRLGSETGVLDTAFQELVEKHSEHEQDTPYRFKQTFAYLFALSLATLLICAFLFIFIVPTLKVIYEEFALTLPASFLSLLRTGDVFVSVLSLPVLATTLMLGVLFFWLFQPLQFLERLCGSALIPSLSRLRSSQLMNLLALAIERGRPVTGSVSTLARYHFDRVIRGKLLFARNEVEQGADIWNGLASAGLLKRNEADALQRAPSNQFRAWMLRTLAEQKRRDVRRRFLFVSQLLYPVIVVLFGCLVAWICIAFFGMLVQLVGQLA
ncbi:MAG: type II secretion system F family protein [Aureliella sp.]